MGNKFLSQIEDVLGLTDLTALHVNETGTGELPSCFAVTDLALATLRAATMQLATLTGLREVVIDRRLASLWFDMTLRPNGWALPDAWDAIAGVYRYYVSQTVLKHGAGSCPVGRVPAGEIEAAVIDKLRAVFRQPEIVAGTWKAARTHADGITEADARAALQQLDPLWDELFPAEQARIVALLVERVDIDTDGLSIRLRVDGLGGFAREMLAGGIEAAA